MTHQLHSPGEAQLLTHDHFYKQELVGYAKEGQGERCEGSEKGEGEGRGV